MDVVQWMDSVLAKGEAMNFFHDEFRCPIFVKDLVAVIQMLTNQWISGSSFLSFVSLHQSDTLCITSMVFKRLAK